MRLLQGDCFDFLKWTRNVDCIFADPPDNLGLCYEGFRDDRPDYFLWLELLLYLALPVCDVFWLSYYYKHDLRIKHSLYTVLKRFPRNARTYIWRFAFGQYRESDSPNGYRPILRVSKLTWKPIIEERIPSVREQMGDLRATGKGRVPDDVWDYCRIQGNNTERRAWHPTQHPESLYRRIIRMSVPDGGTFVDLFAGSGTCFRVATERYETVGCEISEVYCEKLKAEFGGRLSCSGTRAKRNRSD